VKEILHWQILKKFLPTLLLGVTTGICQRALVDKSGMIRIQMETHNRAEKKVTVAWDALCDTIS
jgi:hypothetical protein